MKESKVFIYASDPCWKRLLDANKIIIYLKRNNYKIVEKPEKADVIIIITCAFLNYITEYSLNKIKEFQKYKAELIVAGCLPDIDPNELSKIFKGKVLTTKELDKQIEVLFPPKNIRFSEIDDANILFKNYDEKSYFEPFKKASSKLKSRSNIYSKVGEKISNGFLKNKSIGYRFSKNQYHIRISWGCEGNCSYCVINKAVGSLKSKPLDECIKEFKKGIRKGYKNFILDATDVGIYGLDIGSSFSELLDELTKISGDYKISIRELHPVWVIKYIDELESILKRNKILIFDVAMQSANSRILKMMNRYSNVEKMKDSILRIKNLNSDVYLTLQSIVGFPTETWEEFEDTLNFILESDCSGGQIFSFSCKPGTEAEQIEPKVSEDEIAKRIEYAKKKLQENNYYVSYSHDGLVLEFVKK